MDCMSPLLFVANSLSRRASEPVHYVKRSPVEIMLYWGYTNSFSALHCSHVYLFGLLVSMTCRLSKRTMAELTHWGMTMNDQKLETVLFPRWAEQLLTHEEVWVDIDCISQFTDYLREHHEAIWLKAEQDPSINDAWQSRFYLRTYGH